MRFEGMVLFRRSETSEVESECMKVVSIFTPIVLSLFDVEY